MFDAFLDAFKDTLLMVPFLLAIYLAIEWLESRFGRVIQQDISKAKKTGPIIGALFGCIPQCGFSVVGSALYTRRLITAGTLLAVFISTSDEAIPVLLAQQAEARTLHAVAAILVTKIIIAIIAGYLIDSCWRRKPTLAAAPVARLTTVGGTSSALSCHQPTDHVHQHDAVVEEEIHVDACCGHHVAETERPRAHWWHPIRHTAQVFLFVLAIIFSFNMLLLMFDAESLNRLMLKGTVWQPLLTAIIGLIPNCASSVAITEMFLKGTISFGAAISGLSSSAGLGILVLVKENQSVTDTLRLIGLLLAISMGTGIMLQYGLPVLQPFLP